MKCIKTEMNWYPWCQSAVCVLKHYSELDMSSQRPIHWCRKVTDWTDLTLPVAVRSGWTGWNGRYRCWCIICLQYFVANGLCATWFDLMREAAVFLHAPDKLKMSATKHNKDVMHVCFMPKALLITDCIDFIFNYSHNVLFYALLDLRVWCCKCKRFACHTSRTALCVH